MVLRDNFCWDISERCVILQDYDAFFLTYIAEERTIPYCTGNAAELHLRFDYLDPRPRYRMAQ